MDAESRARAERRLAEAASAAQLKDPRPAYRERLRQLKLAETPEEAARLAQGYAKRGRYHDAYHILVEYVRRRGLDDAVAAARGAAHSP